MKVLSLFDGTATGLFVFKKLNIPVEKYYASEIDKYAIAIAIKNHPEIEQLGDVQRWHWWDIDWCQIDLVIGGSPCQGFSFAGKQLAFDDPRSKLFFEFVAILNYATSKNPKVIFMLENVKMKKEYQDIISDYMGVHPIKIDAGLVSAQRRVRLYWTNIPNVEQPEDRGIMLKDILQPECDVDEKYYISDKQMNYLGKRKDSFPSMQSIDKDKAIPMVSRQYASWNGNFVSSQIGYVNNSNSQGNRVYSDEGKSTTLVGNAGGLGAKTGLYRIGASRGRYKINGVRQDGKMKVAGLTTQQLEMRKDFKTNCLTTVGKDNLLVAEQDNCRIRKLTPIECERLQGLPDGYTDCVSDSQRYKALGNGWQADVIEHIFKGLL